MFDITHILVGLIAAALGVLALKYNYQLVGITGNPDWIESKLGGGSTYFVYKIFALLLVLGGILYATGLIGPVLEVIFSPLKGVFGGGHA